MNTIEFEEPSAEEMTITQQMARKLAFWWQQNVSRRLPRLVWLGDEVDISIRFEGIAALGGDPTRLREIEDAFRDLGLSFDTGSGLDGRDWEWDWSLSGPVHLKFRGRARNPELRCPQPKPPELKLVS